jgi:hypothetical protein
MGAHDKDSMLGQALIRIELAIDSLDRECGFEGTMHYTEIRAHIKTLRDEVESAWQAYAATKTEFVGDGVQSVVLTKEQYEQLMRNSK